MRLTDINIVLIHKMQTAKVHPHFLQSRVNILLNYAQPYPAQGMSIL